MVRRRFRMDALCRGLPKYLFLPEDRCRDKPSRYRASACWAMASPMADRFDRTTSGVPSFSLAGSTIHISEKRRLVTFPFHHVVLCLAEKPMLRTKKR